MQVAGADRGAAGRGDAARGDRGGRRAARRARRARASPTLPLEAPHRRSSTGSATQDPEAKLGLHQLKGADAAVLLRAARRGRAEPELGGDRLPGPEVARRRRAEQAPKTITVEEVSGDVGDADVRRRASSARAPAARVIAAECARGRQGRARARDGRLPQRGGLQPARAARATSSSTTAAGWPRPRTGSIAILAGSTLGGGTVVNYMNCIRTPRARSCAEWAEHGLEGLDDPRVRARPHRRR